MKFSLFNIIFIVPLACLFALQGIWLYYSYQNENIKIQDSLNNALLKSATEEMNNRFSLVEKRKDTNQDIQYPPDLTYKYSFDESKGDLISQQYDFIQQILYYEGFFFNLTEVDSIFGIHLQKDNIHVQYRLNYTDSLGNIIESKGANIDKGFNTIIIPIVNGTKVGAIIKISPPVILQNMLKILVVSILIFFFIIACLVYQIKIYLAQNRLYQLRRNLAITLGHDMKTPLATIHSVLAQLNNGSLDVNPEMKSKFTTIAIEQIANLKTIIDKLLTVAYSNQKRLTLNKQEVDLPQMIHSLIDKFMVRKEKSIEFSEKYNLKDNLIYADPFYLGNAISNLIDNAIKYSGNVVKIDINCTEKDNQIYICVKDDGFGISKKDQQKIYEPFERGTGIKQTRMNGYGLGLSYVKYVIEAHDGSIALTSVEGIGSEFVITIPIN